MHLFANKKFAKKQLNIVQQKKRLPNGRRFLCGRSLLLLSVSVKSTVYEKIRTAQRSWYKSYLFLEIYAAFSWCIFWQQRGVLANKKFLRPITKGLMLSSALCLCKRNVRLSVDILCNLSEIREDALCHDLTANCTAQLGTQHRCQQ